MACCFMRRKRGAWRKRPPSGFPDRRCWRSDGGAGGPICSRRSWPGVNGEDSGWDEADIWRVLGQYARRIHAIALDGFGESLADFQKGNAQAEWRAYVDYNLRSLTPDDALLRLNVYRPEQVEEIRQVFQTLREAPFASA